MPESRDYVRDYVDEVGAAIHEAAHACAALYIGVELQYANITETDTRWGSVQLAEDNGPFDADKARKYIFVTACGVLAEGIFYLPQGGAKSDFRGIEKYLRLDIISDPHRARRDLMWGARSFVLKHQHQILRVAQELQNHGRLDGSAVSKIYHGQEKVFFTAEFINATKELEKRFDEEMAARHISRDEKTGMYLDYFDVFADSNFAAEAEKVYGECPADSKN